MAFWNDCRFAIRQLRRTPAFTLVVLATLGLCIGANTAVFSVLDAVLLRAVPYPEPDRLAMVATTWRHEGQSGMDTSQNGATFEGVRLGASYLDVAAYSGDTGVNFAAGGRLEYVRQQRVSSGFFRVLGISPQFGREFTLPEDTVGGPALAVISYEFWQRTFRGNPSVLGQAMTLRGEPYTVIGIMPRGFRTTVPVDVWTPLRPSRFGEGRGSNYGVVARLRPGITWAEASGQLQVLGPELAAISDFSRKYSVEVRIVPYQKGITEDGRSELLIAWAAVLVVLLIGCVNVAGLLLARSAERSREIATRMALGGGRGAIVRQLLAESLLLSLGGCAVGIGLGAFAIDWLKRLGAANLALWHPIEIDARVIGAMVGLAVLTSVVFGLIPALQTSRVNIRAVLVEGGRGVVGARGRWSRNVLVAGEVALSLVLLIGAGLLVRTLGYLNGLNPGFDTHNVIAAQISLQDARYNTAAAVNQLYQRGIERLRRIPGVQSAAVALTLPYERPLNDGYRTPDGDIQKNRGMEVVYVTPGYFETLRIPILGGRGFRDSDTPESARVAIVSASFAAKYFPGRQAVGRHVQSGRLPQEIVGVVGDVQQHSGLGNFGPISMEPTVYVPASQVSDGFFQLVHTWFSPKWVIRTNGPIAGLGGQVRAAVASADPQLPVASLQTVDDLRGKITSSQRYNAALFSILAGLALVLAAIGLYGLISHSVAQRTHELGVRMALGATAGQMIAGVMQPGIRLVGAGIAAGYLLSFATVRFLGHLLWGVRPNDSLTFAATAMVLLLAAALASLAPALRILRMDPARTLRDE